MKKLKYKDLPDPPTYDSIIKSSINYRIQKFTSYHIKKSKYSFNKLKNTFSKKIKLAIYNLRLNISKASTSIKSYKSKIRLVLKKAKTKTLSSLKYKSSVINLKIQKLKNTFLKLISKLTSFDLEKIVFIASFSLIIAFLVFSFTPFLIADNDNSTFICDGGDSCEKTNTDCDITSYGTTCTYVCTYWNIGGSGDSNGYPIGGATLCCGDDAFENYRSREVNELVMENYADNPSDVACCDSSTDCVNSSVCFTSGLSNMSIDEDEDNDYCDNGEWKDCITNSDCNPGFVCDTDQNDCINVLGIRIQNLGTTGIENTNQEFTSTKNVMLLLNFTDDAIKCRYTNYIDNIDLPAQDYSGWSRWESCISNRLWILSNYSGIKTVFYQIEYLLENVTFNDTIYYNYTGGGLDITPPSKPNVYHNNFTNDNQNITIYWNNVVDPESDLLGIPLNYQIYLYNESDVLLDSATTLNKYYTFDIPISLRQSHGVALYANVTVINSANLKNSSISNDLVIDLIGPNMSFVSGEAYNISKSDYMTILNENTWFYSNQVNLSWNASDTNSSIYAYSYYLSKSYQEPDNVPEGTIGVLHELLDVIYSPLSSGKYYFTIKARDIAGNWGLASSINFSVDSTPPTSFSVITEEQDVNNITYTWSESIDLESDIIYYNATLIDSNGNENQSEILPKTTREVIFTNLSTQNYSAIIYAYNGVGMWTSTGDNQMVLDITPPVIKATPNRTVITNYPILKAWTDEQANCYYNFSNNLVKFSYTNTTYHETKLNYISDGKYDYVISCKDVFENSAQKTINFTIRSDWRPDDILTSGTLSAYESTLTTLSYKIVNAGGEDITGLLNQNFNLKLNTKNHPFSIFDIGNGYYNFTFDVPEYGPYVMEIELDYLDSNVVETITLTVNKLGLNTIYEDSSFITTSDSENHLSYFTSDTRIGLATNDDLEPGYIITNQNNKLNISGIGVKDSVMIFNTKPKISMLDRNKKINKNQFLSSVNPSFGYTINNAYFVSYKLIYDNYLIQSENNLNNGNYELSILYVVEDDQNIIRFKKPSNSDKIVLVSG